jgi:hypothetical protein
MATKSESGRMVRFFSVNVRNAAQAHGIFKTGNRFHHIFNREFQRSGASVPEAF